MKFDAKVLPLNVTVAVTVTVVTCVCREEVGKK